MIRPRRQCLISIVWKSCLALFLASATGCNSNPGGPPALTVVSATDLGRSSTNPDILGRDGAVSAQFQGYSVWLYGDTFLAQPNADGRGLTSDSWSYTTDLNAADGITGFQERLDASNAPEMILPETPTEYAFNQAHNGSPCLQQPCGARWALWPTSIVNDTANNRALIFYMLVYAQPGSFNFKGIGISVALWNDFSQSPQRPNFNPPIVPDHPDLMSIRMSLRLDRLPSSVMGFSISTVAESQATVVTRDADSRGLIPRMRLIQLPGRFTQATGSGRRSLVTRSQ
jgi:hypothetical protein